MSTREYFEARYRRIAAEYGPDIAALHYEFRHGYPEPRIHGRMRQPLPSHPIGNISLPNESKKKGRGRLLSNFKILHSEYGWINCPRGGYPHVPTIHEDYPYGCRDCRYRADISCIHPKVWKKP